MNKKSIRGAREQRRVSTMFEFRDSTDKVLELSGYASVFDAPYDIMGGPPFGWTEIVSSKAFNETLSRNPDLHLLINHEGMPLARTKSGTLSLDTDSHGLKVLAQLDRRDPDVQRLEIKMDRGDMNEMSFAFRVIQDVWSEDDAERTLTEVSLDKGDVSVVNFGANPATNSDLSEVSIQQVLEGIATGDPRILAEARSAGGDDLIARAIRQLRKLDTPTVGQPAKLAANGSPILSVREALRIAELAE